MHKLRGNFFVNSYVKAKFLTHDPARIASFNADPLITRPISVNVLLGLYDVADRIVADAQAIVVPTQLLVSGADWVVHHGPQHAFFDRLERRSRSATSSRVLSRHTGRARPREGRCARALVPAAHVREATRAAGPARRRSGRVHPRRIGHASHLAARVVAARVVLGRHACGHADDQSRCRRGCGLGHATGFDSGSTLDYVYRNQPTGVTPLGRLIDRNYLASIGWRGIRQRKGAYRRAAPAGDRRSARRGGARAHRRHRGGPRPLCARGAYRSRCETLIRFCCATTAS
jgi:hypothetical protein